jgi:hypothetical protein
MANPTNFLREYSLSPPDGTAGESLKAWDIPTRGNIATGVGAKNSATLNLRRAGVAKKWARFEDNVKCPGAFTVDLQDTAPALPPLGFWLETGDRPRIPIYWLPWGSLDIVRIKIPPVPTSLENPDEDRFPRFFMTAGINGCSVFVDGPPDRPTVYHAGITGKLARPSDEFWVEQMEEACEGYAPLGRSHRAVHSKDYMNIDRFKVQEYLQWENGSGNEPFRLEVSSCFGSVIGVRYGRYWSFYLQENVYTQQVHILKKSQVRGRKDALGNRHYNERRGSGAKVTREVRSTPIRIAGVKVGSKKTATYLKKVDAKCRPVNVGEIYPNKSFSADFRTRISTFH